MSLIVLPGMGADASMYGPPWRTLPDARFLDWPTYDGETSLAQVAQRLIQEHGIQRQDLPIGSSLGGMVALEIAAALGCSSVCLVGSALRREEINPLLTTTAPLARLAPFKVAQAVARESSGPLPFSFARTDPKFLRAMCLAIAAWPCIPTERLKVVRVHGTHDWVIRCPADAHTIAGGGHIIAWSHAQECVDLVRRFALDKTG